MSGTDGLESAAATLVGASARVRDALACVWDASDFVARSISTDPTLLTALVAEGDLERSLSAADFAARAPQVPGVGVGAVTEAQWMGQLRRWRRREFVRVAWRDLASWAALPETLADLSAIADAAIIAACAYATRTLTARHGVPR
jgi:glutamate-ammonia-ligase adenylyltransferase